MLEMKGWDVEEYFNQESSLRFRTQEKLEIRPHYWHNCVLNCVTVLVLVMLGILDTSAGICQLQPDQ